MPMKLKAFKAPDKEIFEAEKTARRYHKGNFSKMTRAAIKHYGEFKENERKEKRIASSNNKTR